MPTFLPAHCLRIFCDKHRYNFAPFPSICSYMDKNIQWKTDFHHKFFCMVHAHSFLTNSLEIIYWNDYQYLSYTRFDHLIQPCWSTCLEGFESNRSTRVPFLKLIIYSYKSVLLERLPSTPKRQRSFINEINYFLLNFVNNWLHTCSFCNASQPGVRKNFTPGKAPSNMQMQIRRGRTKIYGSIAVKYIIYNGIKEKS